MASSYDHHHTGVTEITWARFGELCKQLALAVAAYDPEIIVGIAKGGVLPAAVLASLLRREFYPIRLSRRHDDRIVRDRPALLTPMPAAVDGKRVIVVDDIAVKGETLRLAAQEALRLGAAAVKTATQPSGSALNSVKASSIPRSISMVREFIASGRLMVTMVMCSRFS